MNRNPCSIAIRIFKSHVVNWYILRLLYGYKGKFLEADCIFELFYTEIKDPCSLNLLTMT